MEVRLDKCAGFCFGVKRAVDTVYEQLKTGKTIYTYGPIVHNEEVIRELAERGVRVLADVEALEAIPTADERRSATDLHREESEEERSGETRGTGLHREESVERHPERGSGQPPVVIIRAHGVPRTVYGILEEKGLECVDATCPFVKRIHGIVEKESAAGKHIVVVGNPGHPEVEGILGWCRGDATVLETAEEAEKFVPPAGREICVVSQTTFNYNKFYYIVEIFEKKGYNVSVVNTVCSATEERQRSARDLAREADVMIVIGGRHSSNTKKLYDICCEECADTYFIQTLDDLHLELPKSVGLVGITAGASTPNKLIEEVQNYVRINF
ncbi:MAG: 4-hydroxy-3-methylbut-2-enyl diphosphate reductase [Firmicutes bacterium]|nr:4-hydroxy-3-methylbut-2-enyl diphosphate reductase [Bacillota bacterium]